MKLTYDLEWKRNGLHGTKKQSIILEKERCCDMRGKCMMRDEKREKLKKLYNTWSMRLLIVLILELVVLLLGCYVFHQEVVIGFTTVAMALTVVPGTILVIIGAVCEIRCSVKDRGKQGILSMVPEYLALVIVCVGIGFFLERESSYVKESIAFASIMFVVELASAFRRRA